MSNPTDHARKAARQWIPDCGCTGTCGHGDDLGRQDLLAEIIQQAIDAATADLKASLDRIRSEIDCRIQHGADSNGHLEGLRDLFWSAN